MAVILRDKDFLPHELEMNTLMWELFFRPIMDAMDKAKQESTMLYNASSKYPALEKALRDGTVSYSNGTFTGTFNARISKELSTFAKFDRSRKVWVGLLVESSLLAIAVASNLRRMELIQQINDAIDRQLEEAIGRFQFNEDFAGLSSRIDEDVRRTASKGKSTKEPDDVMHEANVYEQAVDAYRNDQKRNVKNWAPTQTKRLRKMVVRMQHGGGTMDTLARQIKAEWGVTSRKAKFLARQETNLLKASLLRTKCLDSGITKYIWRTAEDEHVREYHAQLDGKMFYFGQPPVVSKDGRRAEPGEDYNCRCVAIPVAE